MAALPEDYVDDSPADPKGHIGADDINAITTAVNLLTAAQLTITAVKTGAYPAVVGDFVPVNATSAPVTVTLPANPDDGSVVGVKKVDASANHVTLACGGGGDVFNIAGGFDTLALSVQNQAATVKYKQSVAIWYVICGDADLDYSS